VAKTATLISEDKSLNINTITDKNDTTSWNPDSRETYSFELKLNKISNVNVLLLQENISKGQRIEHFTLEAWVENRWTIVTEGTTVGYKRLLRFPLVRTDKILFTINQSRLVPALAEFGLFCEQDAK
jgi:alpha-L-fucosidase